jgi:hypothetical protein
VQLPIVTGYDGAGESIGALTQVIGRSDKIGNPGPLSTRVGTLEAYAPDYATAKAIRDLLKAGTTALLRQPTHPGMDMYLVAGRVTETMDTSAAVRWVVAIAYEEVVSP